VSHLKIKEILMLKRAWLLKLLLNIWPPFLFTGIKVTELSSDFRQAKVRLKMRSWNKNALGTHFGGSLFSMTDPFYVLMILARLGNKYYVWDKSADINFIKPGVGVVKAEFYVSDDFINEIIENTCHGEKYQPTVNVYVKNNDGELVAQLNRRLYIRQKNK
jgi:acyl-coenzyme A thioesterase PaaI-like protein